MPLHGYLDKRPEVGVDTECYRDYWSFGAEGIETGKKVIIERLPDLPLDRPRIREILKTRRTYTFNGRRYDEPMIALAMTGASNALLKKASDDIIQGQLRPWSFEGYVGFYEKYNCSLPDWVDMIDIFDVAPGVQISQKKYGVRMNMRKLQELPIDPSEDIGVARRPLMRSYLGNDLEVLCEMVRQLDEEIATRAEISSEFGIDVRGKSDAQIAEALIKHIVEKETGRFLKTADKAGMVKTMTFHYVPPPFIKFQTEKMQEVLRVICAAPFHVDASNKRDKKVWGVVKLPQAIKDIKLRIGFTDYKLGIGGLHSKEHRRSFIADETHMLVDRDVRAYYPWLMLACGVVPEAIGNIFEWVFRNSVLLRDKYKALAAKYKDMAKVEKDLELKNKYKDLSAKYKKRADTYKIINNGTFGKAGSPYSILYSPKLLINTTVTGQLSLLMLIERLELAGFAVISANTDGIVTHVERARKGDFDAIVLDWEMDCTLSTEEVEYAGVYSRDVNSYIALPAGFKQDLDPDIKRKGLFAKAGLQSKHDPTFDVCTTAVINYLTDGFDIERSIRMCSDITQFIGVRQVRGGAMKDGEYIGKLVRWYYSVNERGRSINTKESGNRVAGTWGAHPCLDLPTELPEDIDYDWYIREAYARLADVGLNVKNPSLAGRSGYMVANLPNQKTVHLIDNKTSIALCGREEPAGKRLFWQAHDGVPDDFRVCKKCQAERGYEDAEHDPDAI